MKNLSAIKAEKENKVSELIKACSMFFAFSNEQFEKNKTPLQDGEKYVSLGAGAYMPKSQVDNWIKGSKDIDIWYKAALKGNKLRYQNIAYELANHEAFYTCSIDDTLEALGPDYSREEVQAVYWKEYKKYAAANA
jgi:hypothetical protein